MKSDHMNLCKTLSEYSPYIHSVVFGGGEPLLYADEIYSIMRNSNILDENTNAYIITNGSRELFLREIGNCRLCRGLSGIMLSRHHYDDKVNAQIFGNTSLLTQQDIGDELCGLLRGKMEFAITCLKGYIDSVDEICNFVNWGISIGVEKFLFNDLQKDVTDLDYWSSNQIDANVFSDSEKMLILQGFHIDISVCYTAGYDIRTYTRGDVRIGFKRYHKSKEETIQKWKTANRYTYDLSIMPNGEIFSDWTNEHKL
jgi:hypothetical protein